jgi:rhomboid protease GluP
LAECPSCGHDLQLTQDGQLFCPHCAADATRKPAPRPSIAAHFRRFPATTIFIALNILVFVAMLVGHVSPSGPTTDQLIRWGGVSGEQIILHNQWWRIITAAFIHIGVTHLVMNMWALWVLGTLAEAVLGAPLYVGIYLVCAIAGSLASLYWNPLVAGAGASGALMGILGALLSVLKFARLPLPKEVLRSTIRSLVQGAVLTLLIGILPRIDNAAHLGGLTCGLFMGLLLSLTRRADYTVQRPLRQICLIAPFALMVPIAMYVQKRGEPELHLQHAVMQMQTGDYQNAEKEARTAQRHLRDRPDVLEVLAEISIYEAKDTEAATYLRQLISQDPTNEFVVNRLAMIELKEGDASGALELLTRTLPLQPRNGYGQVYCGRALQVLNDDKQAIEHYRKAVEIEPQLYEAQLALGSIYEKDKQPRNALLFYREAAKLRPQEVDPLRGLARVYLEIGAKKEADQTIEQIRVLENSKEQQTGKRGSGSGRK